MRRLPHPTETTLAHIEECLVIIQKILWEDESGDIDENKEWDSSTASDIANVLIDADLGPRSF